MGIATDPFVKLFTIVIQLEPFYLYWFCILSGSLKASIYFKLFIAFIPAAVVWLFAERPYRPDAGKSAARVAVSLVIGGVILLFVDKWFSGASISEEEEINYGTALKIRSFQCLVMIPAYPDREQPSSAACRKT